MLLAGCVPSASKTANGSSTGAGGNVGAVSGPVSKLQITDVKVGTGPTAEPGDLLAVRYSGKLKDGTVFDTNDKPGGHAFSVMLGQGQVIKGWDQGLVGMKVGGERKLAIPAALGYGDKPSDKIPANSDLYFDVTLLDLVKQQDQADVIVKKDQKGTGPAAKMGSKVTLDYTAWLPGNDQIDSTHKRGAPVTFTLGKNEVQKSIEAAVLGMQKGGVREVKFPPKVGFGMGGPGSVSPNSIITIRFEMKSIE